MPKVSINILTKNRAELLRKALISVANQTYKDYEVIVICDGCTDNTPEVEQEFRQSHLPIKFIFHYQSLGIVASRQQALELSKGTYIAVLDDDDKWIDPDKLKKQVEFLEKNSDVSIVGGGIEIKSINLKIKEKRFRPSTDFWIRKTMLFRNNFFTSTVMFYREMALKAGGFINDEVDFGEDYDLWLRLGGLGKMHNIPEVFALYRLPVYNKAKFKAFLNKQIKLIDRERSGYPFYFPADFLLNLRKLL